MHTLAGLYKRCIFRSQAPLETHAVISQELADHNLKWHGGRIDTRFYKFNARRLSLYSLQYGEEVQIFPDVYRDFSLVHFSLRGGIEVQADGLGRQVAQGRAIVSSPTRDIRLHWQNGCEQLILRVPHALLREASGTLGQARLSERLIETPGVLLPEAACAQWLAQLQTFMALESYAQSGPEYTPWLEHLEACMAMFLLLQGGAPGAGAAAGAASAAHESAPHGRCRAQARRRLARLREFVAARLTAPVTLADMAEATALSPRQLNALCHEHLGVSPMVWLRQQRLDAIRRILLSKPATDLSAVAMLHGFGHLGRFAAYYRRRFGELPSRTLRAAHAPESARNG